MASGRIFPIRGESGVRKWYQNSVEGPLHLFLDHSSSLSCHPFRVLLAGADVNLAWGRRYGLVGRNGLGKTTLLKMLATRSLRVPAHISLLHVEQEVAGDDTPALQSVLESDTVREDLLRQERELSVKIAAGR